MVLPSRDESFSDHTLPSPWVFYNLLALRFIQICPCECNYPLNPVLTQFENWEFWFARYSPPRRGGVAARSIKKAAKRPFSAQTGWSVRRILSFAGLTTPSAPYKDASQHFIDVASTPPLRGGECSLARIGKIETESLPWTPQGVDAGGSRCKSGNFW